MPVMRVIVPGRIPSLKFVGLSVLRIWLIFGQGCTALIGLVTLTFRPLNGVTSHPCHGLPTCHFFSLLRPSVLDLGSGTGQTDNRHQCNMPLPMGTEHSIINFNKIIIIIIIQTFVRRTLSVSHGAHIL